MNGLVFDTLVPTAPIDPNRADVACFVGFVARRKADQRGATRVVPSSDAIRAGLSALGSSWPVFAWLDAAGWTRHPYEDQNPQPWTRDHADLETLLDLPVPIEDWETFDRLFAWDERPIVTSSTTDVKSTALLGTTTLGAAVRSFFVQGGRRCYVIRVGDPWSLDASLGVRQLAIGRLLPGFPSALLANRIDRTTWSGIGHLFGLPDVSFVCMPDLADAVSMEYTEPKPVSTQPEVEPVFVEYSTNESVSEPDHFVRGCFAPRCTEQGYKTWAKALQLVARMLQEPANGLREVQLVASVPLPTRTPGAPPAGANLLTWLASEHDWLQGITNSNDTLSESFGSAFVQLAWPWVKTMGARNLPEALESPDAVLVGVLARNALTRGAFRSATGLPLADVHDVYPPLRGVDLTLSDESDTLIGRVSLLGPDAGMMRLLSDVTTFPGYGYRQANVNRLLSAIVRAARRLGEDFAFATSGPELWTSIRTSLNALLTQLWHDGALRGQSAKEAFSVRCDRTLMTEQDIDEGRVLVEVQFEAASAIEQIRVVLALANGNGVGSGGENERTRCSPTRIQLRGDVYRDCLGWESTATA